MDFHFENCVFYGNWKNPKLCKTMKKWIEIRHNLCMLIYALAYISITSLNRRPHGPPNYLSINEYSPVIRGRNFDGFIWPYCGQINKPWYIIIRLGLRLSCPLMVLACLYFCGRVNTVWHRKCTVCPRSVVHF